MNRQLAVLAIAALAALSLAACGGDDEEGGGGGDVTTPVETTTNGNGGNGTRGGNGGNGGEQVLRLTADPEGALRFDKDSLSADAGTITIELENPSPLPHDVVVEQGSKELARTQTITSGSDSLTATLQPGEYAFYCSVPGHREGGMEGTLSVD